MPVPKRLLLDTDIVIQLLKKRSEVLECFIDLHEQGVEFYSRGTVVCNPRPERFEVTDGGHIPSGFGMQSYRAH